MLDIFTPALLVTSLLIWLPTCTQAHMQMSSPYPIRSPLDPDVPWYEKDYDMTSPLFDDGSDFACKRYHLDDDSYAIKATYVAGGTYQMSVAGTASHMGGSCQLSLSYDNGHSFKVIKSVIGGCPLSNSYSFTIPSNAPSSETVLFSWSWFNIVGNREMYQNCARVKVINNPSQRYKREMSWKRQYSPLTQLPDMFVCNVGNGCTTIEQREVVFPDPGSDVSYGTNEINPVPGPGFTISGSASSSSSTDGGIVTTTQTTSTVSSLPSVTSEFVDSSTSASVTTTITSSGTEPTSTLSEPPSTTSPNPEPTSTSSEPLSTTSPDPEPITTSSAPFPTLSSTTATAGPTGTGTTASSDTTLTVTGSLTSTTSHDDVLTTSTSTSTAVTSTVTTEIITSTSTASSTMSTESSFPTLSSPSTTTATTMVTSTLSITTTIPSVTLSPTTTLPTTTLTTTTTATTSPSSTAIPQDCVPGTFTCNSSSTFSQCVSTSSSSTTYVYMGSVAAGMQCVNGQIIRQNDGPCTPSGSIFCNGLQAFYMCDQGGLINMGPVAPGTECRNGEIGFPE